MRHKWEPEDLIASWTLVKPDWDLVANKTGGTRLGFSECTKADRVELAGWLSRELCPTEFRREPLRSAVIARGRALQPEPPTYGQISRLVNSAAGSLEAAAPSTPPTRRWKNSDAS